MIESKQGWAAGVFIDEELGDGTAAIAGHIRGNTFELVKGAANHAGGFLVSGIIVDDVVNTGSSISGNQFGVKVDGTLVSSAIEAVGAGTHAAGIMVGRNGFTGTIGCGADETNNCANKFGVIESKQGWAAGVLVSRALGDAEGNAGHIRGNTFELVKGAANLVAFPVSGIVVLQAVNTGSSISGNQFGVKVNGDSITGNAIEATAQGAQADVAGIYVKTNVFGTIGCTTDTAEIASDACKNNFTNITSTEGDAYGLKIDGDSSGTINYNDFTVHALDNSQNAYGIYFETNFSVAENAKKVTNNILSVTAAGADKAIGISLKNGDADAKKFLDDLAQDKKNTFGVNIATGNKVKVRDA